MKIYPPYTQWTTMIKDPSAFQKFLRENVDTCDTGRYTKYRGDVSQESFRIERNLNHFNTNRPQIHGQIEANASGKQKLTLNIESRKTLFYFVLVFSILICLTAIIQLNALVLVFIPVVVFWFWLAGLIFHLIEINQTKIEVEYILNIAQGESK